MTLKRLSAVCILLAAIGAPLPFAPAQVGFDRAIVSAETIGAAQEQQIQRHVEQWGPRLADEDPRECRRAREQLLQPLRERTITVAFRQAYDRHLTPVLGDHARADDDRVVVNALRIAGELATPGAVRILEDKLQDAQLPIRYAAVVNLGTVFAVVRDHSPAIGSDGVRQVVARLDQTLQRERDPIVLDGAVRSLEIALGVTRRNYETTRTAAFTAMTQRIGGIARNLGEEADSDELLRVFLRAAQISRDALVDRDPRRQLGEGGIREAAEMNGQFLAYVVRRVHGGGFPQNDPDARYVATQIVAAAETAIIMAANQGGQQVQAANLVNEFRQATPEGDRRFRDRAMDFLGVLTRPPFNFTVEHFGGR